MFSHLDGCHAVKAHVPYHLQCFLAQSREAGRERRMRGGSSASFGSSDPHRLHGFGVSRSISARFTVILIAFFRYRWCRRDRFARNIHWWGISVYLNLYLKFYEKLRRKRGLNQQVANAKVQSTSLCQLLCPVIVWDHTTQQFKATTGGIVHQIHHFRLYIRSMLKPAVIEGRAPL